MAVAPAGCSTVGVVADLQCAVGACLACGASLAVAVADGGAVCLAFLHQASIGVVGVGFLAAVWQAAAGSASAQVVVVVGGSA